MPVLKLDRWLGKSVNRVARVGVELEGGWVKLPPNVGALEHDGSVFKCPVKGVQIPPIAGMPVGELASEPIEPIRVADWMRKNYPTHVDATCGLHVHMSFKSALYYAWLMDADFQTTMGWYLEEFGREERLSPVHPLWPRVRGESKHCKFLFWADMQTQRRQKNHNMEAEGNRYTAINYCFGLHKTLECRLLPMFTDVNQAIRAVHRVMEVTNASLTVLARKEGRLSSSLKLRDEQYVEEREVFV